MTTATSHHTEATLKARYNEALDILKALEDREALSGGTALTSVLVQKAEAMDWVEITAKDLALYRSVMHQKNATRPRSAANTHGRLHAHGRH